MEDLGDEALNSFIKDAQKEYADTAKLFGVEETGAGSNNGKTKGNEDGITGDEAIDDDPVAQAIREVIK